MCQDQEADAEGQESGRPKNSTYTEGTRLRCDELLTTLFTVKQRAQERRLLSRSHHQITSGPPASRNRQLHTKDRPFNCLPPLMCNRWSASEYSWFVHYVTLLQHCTIIETTILTLHCFGAAICTIIEPTTHLALL